MSAQIDNVNTLVDEFFSVLTRTEAIRIRSLYPYLNDTNRVRATLPDIASFMGTTEQATRRILLQIQAKKIAGDDPLLFMRILERPEYIIEFSPSILRVLHYLNKE